MPHLTLQEDGKMPIKQPFTILRRIVFYYVTFACLALPSLVQASVGTDGPDTWYVRPSGSCNYSGNGLDYGCASSAGASGAIIGFRGLNWLPTTGIGPGDTVTICGEFTAADRSNNTTMIGVRASGTTNKRITFTGDCSAEGDLPRAILDAEQISRYNVLVAHEDYITLADFDGLNASTVGILGGRTSSGGIEGFHVQGIRLFRTGATCLVVTSKRYLIEDFWLEDCGGDGIYLGSGSADTTYGIVRRGTVNRVDAAELGIGDGVKMQNCMNSAACSIDVDEITVYKSGINKSGILVHGAAGGCRVTNNRVIGLPGNDSAGITLDGVADCTVANNYVSGMTRMGIAIIELLGGTITGTISIVENTVRDIPAESGVDIATNSGPGVIKVRDNQLGRDGDVLDGVTVGRSTDLDQLHISGNWISATRNYYRITALALPSWESSDNYFDARFGATWWVDSTQHPSLRDFTLAIGDDEDSVEFHPI
jgi:hypothetical protein